MQVTTTTFTIAEYCEQMRERKIIANRDYQRSSAIWPPAARSHLVDTIINGYPVPKIILNQITDIATRSTRKEIVDGQQRSRVLQDFFDDKFKITGRNAFAGCRFSDLDNEAQQRFISYQISADIIVGATPDEVRQVFRRINSYTVPLNHQEKRHATYQNDFKWFINAQSDKFSGLLLLIGSFNESQLNRMADAEFFSEVIYSLARGIDHASQAKLDNLYKTYEGEAGIDARMMAIAQYEEWLEYSLAVVSGCQPFYGSALYRSYCLYSILTALIHIADPIPALQGSWDVRRRRRLGADEVLNRLSPLLAALEAEDPLGNEHPLRGFVDACASATNRKAQRLARFVAVCKALDDVP